MNKATKKTPAVSTYRSVNQLDATLHRVHERAGWKTLTAFVVGWFRKHQPEERAYSLHYWMHDGSTYPVIYPKESFRVLIELDPADEELERKLTIALVNNHFAYSIQQSHDADPVRIYVLTMIDRVHILNKILKRVNL